MRVTTSHNDLAEMLSPREVGGWQGGVYTFWDRDLLIMNEANEAFDQSLEDLEEDAWDEMEVFWTGELRRIEGVRRRAWHEDYLLLQRLMSVEQMLRFLPQLLAQVQNLSRHALSLRRKVVSRYLLKKHNATLSRFPVLTRQFALTAPLLYPPADFTWKSERFAAVISWNADQSREGQRGRLVTYIRAFVRMKEEELVCRFTDQDSYERELERLLILSRDFRLTVADIYQSDDPRRINVTLE